MEAGEQKAIAAKDLPQIADWQIHNTVHCRTLYFNQAHNRAETGAIRLIYKARQPGSDWESFDYRVPIEWIPCIFRGRRPYFLCPALKNGRGCFRRSSKLHGGAIFACRNCHDLSYSSQSEDKLKRLYRKARKLRRKIDPDGDFEFIRRPKGMWNHTYERAKGAYWGAEDQADELFTLIVGGKLGLLK